jgi:hypothetical protein
VAAKQPTWHPDLSAVDLSTYLRDMQLKKRWWLSEPPAGLQAQQGEDGACHYSILCVQYLSASVSMADADPITSWSPSAPLPSPSADPPTHKSTSKGKGKARAVADPPAATPPYDLRGTKRNKDVAAEPSVDEETQLTPHKADGPHTAGVPVVQVDEASPPSNRRRTASPQPGMVAIGPVRIVLL